MTYICLKRPWPGEPPWWGCSGLGGWAARGWCACRSSALRATPNQSVKLLLAFVVCCVTPDASAVLAPVRSGDKAWRQIKDLGNWSLTVQHSLTIITIISLNHSHQCRELRRNRIQQSCTFPERLKDLLGFLKKPLKSMQIILRNSNLNLLISCARALTERHHSNKQFQLRVLSSTMPRLGFLLAGIWVLKMHIVAQLIKKRAVKLHGLNLHSNLSNRNLVVFQYAGLSLKFFEMFEAVGPTSKEPSKTVRLYQSDINGPSIHR